ncbi:unnamed protein product [Periconia digitata]|uniref:C2H2-type domain-containing protein n=1 Tax=Periconia digitata TaxID=1303443 RepID=A0A9W4U940_9PLEO|nr:unnamed protein product [Periconia digitata]
MQINVLADTCVCCGDQVGLRSQLLKHMTRHVFEILRNRGLELVISFIDGITIVQTSVLMESSPDAIMDIVGMVSRIQSERVTDKIIAVTAPTELSVLSCFGIDAVSLQTMDLKKLCKWRAFTLCFYIKEAEAANIGLYISGYIKADGWCVMLFKSGDLDACFAEGPVQSCDEHYSRAIRSLVLAIRLNV